MIWGKTQTNKQTHTHNFTFHAYTAPLTIKSHFIANIYCKQNPVQMQYGCSKSQMKFPNWTAHWFLIFNSSEKITLPLSEICLCAVVSLTLSRVSVRTWLWYWTKPTLFSKISLNLSRQIKNFREWAWNRLLSANIPVKVLIACQI